VIEFLDGELAEAFPTHAIIDVRGVGYCVHIPLSTYEKLPATGARVRILTHMVVREDAHLLYGFGGTAERDLFRLLLHHVNGVGPKIALAIVSGLPVEFFKAAVVAGDVASISKISGVGKKTAERIVLELKDRLGVAAEWEAASAANAPSPHDRAIHDAVLALISLGYKQAEAHKAIKATLGGQNGLPAEEIVRLALKSLA
jgi:holliday junction DNA helicase RuvA